MENEERKRERLPVREQLSRANRATCRHVNWLASLISILFGNLSRVKLRRATIDDNTGLRYTFPSPPPPPSLRLLTRHEFNSRGRSSYESVRSCGKMALFRFFHTTDPSPRLSTIVTLDRLSFFFLRFENLQLIYSLSDPPSPTRRRKLSMIHLFATFLFRSPPLRSLEGRWFRVPRRVSLKLRE